MARKILKICAKIVGNIKKRIFSKEFLSRHRKAENFFIRNVTLTFPVLILFLMNLLKSSLQRELNQYFKLTSQGPIAKQIVVKSAFTKARKKFSYTAFIELNELLVEETKQEFPLQNWYGFRLVANQSQIKPSLQFGFNPSTRHNNVQMRIVTSRTSQLFRQRQHYVTINHAGVKSCTDLTDKIVDVLLCTRQTKTALAA